MVINAHSDNYDEFKAMHFQIALGGKSIIGYVLAEEHPQQISRIAATFEKNESVRLEVAFASLNLMDEQLLEDFPDAIHSDGIGIGI